MHSDDAAKHRHLRRIATCNTARECWRGVETELWIRAAGEELQHAPLFAHK